MVGKNLQVPTDLCFVVKLTALFSYLKKAALIISLKTNKYTGGSTPACAALHIWSFSLHPAVLPPDNISCLCPIFLCLNTLTLSLSLSMPCELSVLVHLLLLHLSPWLQSCITLSPSLSTLCEFVFHPFQPHQSFCPSPSCLAACCWSCKRLFLHIHDISISCVTIMLYLSCWRWD